MEIEIKVQEDENFKLNPRKEERVAEQPQVQNVVERPRPTLENPKGHSWFNGTSWGAQ